MSIKMPAGVPTIMKANGSKCAPFAVTLKGRPHGRINPETTDCFGYMRVEETVSSGL
jgi:hypothetical protein